MKIAFNTTPLQNNHKKRGTGSYTLSLLQVLKTLQSSNFQVTEFTDEIPKDCDLAHYPFFDPFFLTLPIIKSKPTVVTVHDLIPLKFPEKFPKGLKGEIKWQLQKFSLAQAKAVITDSKNSARDIHLITGIAKEKIYTIPLAANKIYKPITDRDILERIKTKYNLPERFILYVGDVNWNKNIAGLIRAYAEIRKDFQKRHSGKFRRTSGRIQNRFWTSQNDDIKLVLAGKSFLNNTLSEVQEINNLAKQLDISDSVLKLGFVPEEDLVSVYNLAKVYVQPSFYEGFGLPVLEALSCGCPVVCSNASSLPEVGGDAVFYFNPENINDMVEKISLVLNYDTVQYHSVQKKGWEWIKNFTWEKTARETIKVHYSLV